MPLPKPNPSPRRAFTLVEMLVVIAIISILLVAVIPAVNSLSKSNGRKAAVGELLGVVEQARAQAMKDEQATYLVFPTFTGGAQATLDRYNYKAFAIFEDDPANPNTPKQLTAWQTLPTGICLRADSTTNEAVTNLPNLASLVKTAPAFTIDTTSTPVFYGIKFNTDGGVDNPPINFSLAVFEGFVSGTNETPTTKPLTAESITASHLTGRAVHNT